MCEFKTDPEEFFKMRFAESPLVRMPEETSHQLHPATELLQRQRELGAAEQALQSEGLEYGVKSEVLEQRASELAKKEQSIKQWLLRYDNFLKENSDKRDRAIKRALEEKVMQQQKEKEIKRLRRDIDLLLRLKTKLAQKVKTYHVYQRYLEQVLALSDEFSELRDILDRYETLTTTYVDLMEREQKNQDIIDEVKVQMRSYTEEMQTEILSYNNRLSDLQTAFDEAHVKAVEWESTWMHIKNTAAKKTLFLGQIKMACHNLYQIILKIPRRGVAPEVATTTDDTIEQLSRILYVLEDLECIVNEVRKTRSTSSAHSSM